MNKVQESKMRNPRQQGFTLVELLVVIVVIGLLASMALPKFGSFTAEARKATNSYVASSKNSRESCVAAAMDGGKTGAQANIMCGDGTAVIGGNQ